MTENIERSKYDVSRRNWLMAAGRWGIVALITGVVGGLWRRGRISPHREACADVEGRVGCRDCTYLADCGHPKALSAKQILKKHG